MKQRLTYLAFALAVGSPTPVFLGGCTEEEPHELTREELMDPETCRPCHERHYLEWKSSMHAYAADDPVFLAMNQRGQREAALGDFCVNCHAPLAVSEGWTQDGLNLDEVPQHLKGVTCYFCHSVDGLGEADHNNPLQLADNNDVMFGPFDDPVSNTPHKAAYSPFLDGSRRESSDMCGKCHDIMLPSGVHLERTYSEWKKTALAQEEDYQSCARGCHMDFRMDNVVSGPMAADFRNVQPREVHEHLWAGIDTALTPFPPDEPQLMEGQKQAIRHALQDALLITRACIDHPGNVPVGAVVRMDIEGIGMGHRFPSGATQDRRAWIELTAYKDGEVLFTSGHVEEGEAVVDVQAQDPTTKVLRDITVDAQGNPAHMFWDVAGFDPDPFNPATALTVPEPAPPGSLQDHTYEASWRIMDGVPDRIEAVVKVRAVGLDVLEDLYEHPEDLTPEDHAPIPTFELEGTRLDWQPEFENGFGCVNSPPVSTKTYQPCEHRVYFGGTPCDDD